MSFALWYRPQPPRRSWPQRQRRRAWPLRATCARPTPPGHRTPTSAARLLPLFPLSASRAGGVIEQAASFLLRWSCCRKRSGTSFTPHPSPPSPSPGLPRPSRGYPACLPPQVPSRTEAFETWKKDVGAEAQKQLAYIRSLPHPGTPCPSPAEFPSPNHTVVFYKPNKATTSRRLPKLFVPL